MAFAVFYLSGVGITFFFFSVFCDLLTKHLNVVISERGAAAPECRTATPSPRQSPVS